MSLENGFRNDTLENKEEKAKMLEESISRVEQELEITTDEEKKNELKKALEELRNK
jgi:hypothetical protein